MFLRALLFLTAGSCLFVSLTGCSALTRPDEVTIQAEPAAAQRPEQGAAVAAPEQGEAPKRVFPTRRAPEPAQAPPAGCGE